MKPTGLVVVLSAPSGGGKTTVIQQLLKQGDPRYRYSISMTTRPRRRGDVEGKDYFFVDEERFRAAIAAGDLVEYEQVHGYLYGTPKRLLQQWVQQGYVVLLDLDVFGALALKKLFAEKCLTIFLKPPDLDTLVKRLQQRKTESPQQIQRRLKRLPQEMAEAAHFDHCVTNENLHQTVAEVERLIKKAYAQER
ncbi:guanylate kinase [bacterium]|nr:guanylate kinase [bacterium]